MRAVLISIQPKWCELIASGKKTVEVRKTKPKIETPFKCYIYCTADRRKHIADTFVPQTPLFVKNGMAKSSISREDGLPWKLCNGKVMGEFVCFKIDQIGWISTPAKMDWKNHYNKDSCLTNNQLYDYSNGDCFYEWHITDLVVYDEPRELSEFYTEGDCDCMNCKKCYWFDRGNGYNVEDDCNLAYKAVGTRKSFKPLFRPPQSWCYVEERGEGL